MRSSLERDHLSGGRPASRDPSGAVGAGGHLYRRGMMTPNLWRDPSPSEALAEIREALDTRSSLEGQK